MLTMPYIFPPARRLAQILSQNPRVAAFFNSFTPPEAFPTYYCDLIMRLDELGYLNNDMLWDHLGELQTMRLIDEETAASIDEHFMYLLKFTWDSADSITYFLKMIKVDCRRGKVDSGSSSETDETDEIEAPKALGEDPELSSSDARILRIQFLVRLSNTFESSETPISLSLDGLKKILKDDRTCHGWALLSIIRVACGRDCFVLPELSNLAHSLKYFFTMHIPLQDLLVFFGVIASEATRFSSHHPYFTPGRPTFSPDPDCPHIFIAALGGAGYIHSYLDGLDHAFNNKPSLYYDEAEMAQPVYLLEKIALYSDEDWEAFGMKQKALLLNVVFAMKMGALCISDEQTQETSLHETFLRYYRIFFEAISPGSNTKKLEARLDEIFIAALEMQPTAQQLKKEAELIHQTTELLLTSPEVASDQAEPLPISLLRAVMLEHTFLLLRRETQRTVSDMKAAINSSIYNPPQVIERAETAVVTTTAATPQSKEEISYVV